MGNVRLRVSTHLQTQVSNIIFCDGSAGVFLCNKRTVLNPPVRPQAKMSQRFEFSDAVSMLSTQKTEQLLFLLFHYFCKIQSFLQHFQKCRVYINSLISEVYSTMFGKNKNTLYLISFLNERSYIPAKSITENDSP